MDIENMLVGDEGHIQPSDIMLFESGAYAVPKVTKIRVSMYRRSRVESQHTVDIQRTKTGIIITNEGIIDRLPEYAISPETRADMGFMQTRIDNGRFLVIENMPEDGVTITKYYLPDFRE